MSWQSGLINYTLFSYKLYLTSVNHHGTPAGAEVHGWHTQLRQRENLAGLLLSLTPRWTSTSVSGTLHMEHGALFLSAAAALSSLVPIQTPSPASTQNDDSCSNQFQVIRCYLFQMKLFLASYKINSTLPISCTYLQHVCATRRKTYFKAE